MAVWGLSVAPLNNEIDIRLKTAVVRITTNIQNHGKNNATATVSGTLNDASGAVVCQLEASGTTISSESVVPLTQLCNLSSITLWSPSNPYLYDFDLDSNCAYCSSLKTWISLGTRQLLPSLLTENVTRFKRLSEFGTHRSLPAGGLYSMECLPSFKGAVFIMIMVCLLSLEYPSAQSDYSLGCASRCAGQPCD